MTKEIVVSGTRPTAYLHLGNYFGAVKQFVEMQEKFNSYFFIADYHSLTTHPDAASLTENVKEVTAEYLACGLDPGKATIYLQSSLPQIPELYLVLNMHAYKGELERVATFKEKVRAQPDNVNAGLLTYPVLMAADILIHKATKVPVGKDQEQHLEMARNFASRFNRIYNKEVLVEPAAYSFTGELIKIPSLDNTGKMSGSGSAANAVFINETPEAIRKKVMRAVTDSGPAHPGAPKSDPVQNLFDLMKHLSSPDTFYFFEEQYNTGAIRYGDMKKQLAEDIVAFVNPIREKIIEIRKNDDYIEKVLKQGAEKARESANQTMQEVREAIGMKYFRG